MVVSGASWVEFAAKGGFKARCLAKAARNMSLLSRMGCSRKMRNNHAFAHLGQCTGKSRRVLPLEGSEDKSCKLMKDRGHH